MSASPRSVSPCMRLKGWNLSSSRRAARVLIVIAVVVLAASLALKIARLRPVRSAVSPRAKHAVSKDAHLVAVSVVSTRPVVSRVASSAPKGAVNAAIGKALVAVPRVASAVAVSKGLKRAAALPNRARRAHALRLVRLVSALMVSVARGVALVVKPVRKEATTIVAAVAKALAAKAGAVSATALHSATVRRHVAMTLVLPARAQAVMTTGVSVRNVPLLAIVRVRSRAKPGNKRRVVDLRATDPE